jgi:glycerol-3-phosphate acyltransferase PlsY
MIHAGQALWIVGAYLLGAIPASLLVAKWLGHLDLRAVGSGNLGATNLYRAMGWKGAIPAALFDVGKGAVAVLVVRHQGIHPWFPLAAGAATVLGHVFSPFVRFRGGKGVATAAGAFAALSPLGVLVAGIVFALVVKLTGYVSLGSMIAAGVFLASVPLLHPGNAPMLAAAAGVFVFIVYTHRDNVARLRAGTENRFGRKPAAGAA